MDNYSSSSTDELLYMLLVGLFLIEFAVGVVQLIGAIIRTIVTINKNKPSRKLKIYWIVVLGYFLVFVALYYLQQYFINSIISNNLNNFNSEAYLTRMKMYSYFMYTYIGWIAAAWLVAVWYWVYIVFAKNKKEIVQDTFSADDIAPRNDTLTDE